MQQVRQVLGERFSAVQLRGTLVLRQAALENRTAADTARSDDVRRGSG
ncbi:hypothetical protein [Saccharopolyspora hordei]|uniref:Uncharacterized protein n=1 Tax=Saccharopolyspora hordei TaxID=1838 RepID=A0A853AFU2_9PSEU|nr:hypothetical protein [Saccharopolyspora hordei]NYI83015.1 hypothetical protein [Saccharopolyspora hordei]